MFEIKGIWTGRAQDVKPQKAITIPATTSRVFYRFEQLDQLKETIKTVVRVYLDGKEILKELADFKPGDAIDTGFFDVPLSMRKDTVGIIIKVFMWGIEPEDAKQIFSSEAFGITYEEKKFSTE